MTIRQVLRCMDKPDLSIKTVQNIAVDCRMIHSSGIGACIKGCLPYLMEQNPKWRFFLLGDPNLLGGFSWAHDMNAEIMDFDPPIYSIAEQLAWLRINTRRFDIIWAPNFNIPLFARSKLLVTVHDVIYVARPEFFGRVKAIYARFFYARIQRQAAAISFDSQFTMLDFRRLVGDPVGHYSVNYNGIERKWFTPPQCLRPLSMREDRPFIIFVGNVKPHKNLRRLIEAFSLLVESVPHRLIIVGQKDGFRTADDDILDFAAPLGDLVHFTGFIDDDQLQAIIAKADLLVQPSLYEGFGLTPLEALAAGTQVAISDIPVFAETCPDAEFVFDPLSPADIAAKIKAALAGGRPSAAAREALGSRFSWAQHSLNMAGLIERSLSAAAA